MKRLMQISLDTILTSVLPIVMWIFLGVILTKDISNVFSLTYPLQFFFMFFEEIFGKGPNVTAERRNDRDIVHTNIWAGIVVVGISIIVLVCNVDVYIDFMNMDSNFYHSFCIYSILWLYLSFVLQMILQKMYFEDKNSEANRICVISNLTNFVSILVLSFLFKDVLAIAITLSIDAAIIAIVLYKNLKIPKFHFCLKENIKYSSFGIIRNICMFLTYGIGMSRSFSYGERFVIATNFESLTTDMQWDALYSVDTLSKVDIAKGNFDYKESLKSAYKLLVILIGSTIIMNILLYSFYRPDLKILIVLLGIQFIDMATDPLKTLRMSYLQINESGAKHNIFMTITRCIRVCCSFIPSAFCTYISQFVSMVLMLLYSFVQCKNVSVFRLKKENKV